jgi:hypothetical protein
MKCVRIYAGADGQSHFADIEIPLNLLELPGLPPVWVSARHKATSVQFVTVPAEIRESGWHNSREPFVGIWLNGETEIETSDGEIRRIPPGTPILAEDTWGKGHTSRHPPEEQNLIIIPVPEGL